MAVVTSSEVINTGYAVLALVADALVLLAVIALRRLAHVAVGARALGTLARRRSRPFALQIAWIVAVLATFGSLFLQFCESFNPCEFCWFQRICMYPLSLLLGIAAFRGDVQVAKRYFIGLVAGRRRARHLPLPAGARPRRADRVRDRRAVQRRGRSTSSDSSRSRSCRWPHSSLITTLLLMARSHSDE